MKQMNEKGQVYNTLLEPNAVTGRPAVRTFQADPTPKPFQVDFRTVGGHLFLHDGQGNRTIESCGRSQCRVCGSQVVR